MDIVILPQLDGELPGRVVTVAFDPRGGRVEPASAEFVVGLPFGELPVPERDGYEFDCWRTLPEGGEPVGADTPVAEGTERIYASWRVDPFAAAICETGNMSFRREGDGEWTLDGSDFVTGPASAVSPDGPAPGSASIVSSVTGGGLLSFSWKSQSRPADGRLRVEIDGVEYGTLTGVTDWSRVSVRISGDTRHEVAWRYERTGGGGRGRVDAISWTPEG